MKGIKTILTSEKALKGLGTVKRIVSKGCEIAIPIIQVALVGKSVSDIADDLKLRCGSVGYDDAVKVISESGMYSGDKTKVILALKRNEETDFYRAVINTAKSSMYSSDKVKIILKMCGENDE